MRRTNTSRDRPARTSRTTRPRTRSDDEVKPFVPNKAGSDRRSRPRSSDSRGYSSDRRDRVRPSRFQAYKDSKDSNRLQMHEITCDKCGEQSEVPFKPTSSKPIYSPHTFLLP